jgi:hypothetical protein
MSASVRLMHFLALMLYTLLTAAILLITHASYTVTALVLIVAPMFILWQQIDLRTRLLPVISVIAIGITLTVQLYAYIHGLWYEMTVSDVWVLSLVPLESLLFGTLLILYYVVLYEYFFDDQKGRLRTTYIARMLAVVMGVTALMVGYVFISPEPLFTKPYLYLVGILLGMLVLIIGIRRSTVRVKIMLRGLYFSLAIFPLSFIGELVLIANDGRFFAHLTEYAYVFTVFGQAIPLEEFLNLLLFPWWIVVMYELLLDDGR